MYNLEMKYLLIGYVVGMDCRVISIGKVRELLISNREVGLRRRKIRVGKDIYSSLLML